MTSRGLLLVLALSGCTAGRVYDPVTSIGQNGATVDVWDLNAVPRNVYMQPEEWPLVATPTWTTTTTDHPTGGVGWFWFDPMTNTRSNYQSGGAAIPAGFDRFRVELDGYRPGIFYRNHRFDAKCRNFASTSELAKEPCDLAGYPILKSTAVGVDLLPDLAPGPRDLEVMWQCDLPTSGAPIHELRLRTGSLNVGAGPLDLEYLAGSNQTVQHVHYSDAGFHDVVLNGSFEYHPSHHHNHFKDWVAFRVVRAESACMPQPGVARDDSYCVLRGGQKVSSCLADIYTADAEIRALAKPRFGDSKFPLKTPNPDDICHSLHQGISPGYKDYYGESLHDQQVDITGLGNGDYVMEIEIDPKHVLKEASTANNIARVPFTLPLKPAFQWCPPDRASWTD